MEYFKEEIKSDKMNMALSQSAKSPIKLTNMRKSPLSSGLQSESSASDL